MNYLFVILLLTTVTVGCKDSGGGDEASTPTENTEVVQNPVEPTPDPIPDPTPDPAPSCEVAPTPERLKGLKPITDKELSTMQLEHGMKRIKGVRPNKLGFSRMSKLGNQKISVSESGEDTEVENEEAAIYGGSLPVSIDNSTLAAFPAIGQQALNSCVPWAVGYYQWSHNNGLALGWNNKTSSANRCSPKFVYTMINEGVDDGSYFSDALNMLQKHGCITWDNFPEDRDFRAWNTNSEHWKAAISYRSNTAQYVNNVDTATGLEQVKQLLTNGYVLSFGTYIDSFQYTTIKSGTHTGKWVVSHVSGTKGPHAMTIVGYDDSAWTDLNANNVVDVGETGVLKIANSWGGSWKNNGFVFMTYDALKALTGVSGGSSSGRVAAFQGKMAYHMPVKASNGVAYKPKYLAKVSLSHATRNQLSLKFGWSTKTFSPYAMFNKGGANSFTGSAMMDLTDMGITDPEAYPFRLTVSDNQSGNAASVSGFEVIDVVSSQVASGLSSTLSVDGTSKTVNAEFTPAVINTPPVSRIFASATTGTAPVAIQFDGSASSDAEGAIVSYSWNFGNGSTASGAYVTKTFQQAGTYNVTLTVKDQDGITSTSSKTIRVESPVVVCE